MATPPANDTTVHGVPSHVTYDDLPGYSRVLVNIYRWSAGADYDLTQYLGTYVRYDYYDWNDDMRSPAMVARATWSWAA